MDLRHRAAQATPAEREAVDALLGAPSSRWEGGTRDGAGDGVGRGSGDDRVARGGHQARARRHLLLPALHAVQDTIGWISEGALSYVCQRLSVPPAEAYGVATFYALLSVQPRPPRVAHVCEDVACLMAGSEGLAADLADRLGEPGQASGEATWVPSPCLGLCERAPAVFLQLAGEPNDVVAPAQAAEVVAALGGDGVPPAPSGEASVPQAAAGAPGDGREGLRLLRRAGLADPASLDDYRAHGGYEALRRALELGPAGVLREVTDSRLLGRGGAAFPTGVKWEAVARAPVHPHYVICNADESEPGTFKDRVLLEADPFAVVEAMTVAGFATGAARGYVYLRGEYPVAERRLAAALETARRRGLLGERVLGQAFDFDIEIRRGAGAYICGEETALMNSIEGYRGEPRNKPPFPTDVGLFGKPTLVNNVETLCAVLDVLASGGPAYARVGSEQSTGTKLYCVSGAVRRPGLYEVAFGATLGDLLSLAGGLPDGRTLRAVLLGGAAGTFVGPDSLDLALTFEGTRAARTALGSGVVLAIDDACDVAALVARIAAFFREESCGQCVPCRVGTVRQEESLGRLLAGPPDVRAREQGLLGELAQVMRDASICGLGQTAASALTSALELGLLEPAEPVGPVGGARS